MRRIVRRFLAWLDARAAARSAELVQRQRLQRILGLHVHHARELSTLIERARRCRD